MCCQFLWICFWTTTATGRAGVVDEEAACLHSRPAWLQHCAAAEDCTSDASFCSCCAAHAYSEYAAACGVICDSSEPVESAGSESWRFTEFGDASFEAERGPNFEQPVLSLVGDAAVVVGDCYNLKLQTTETVEGEQRTCIIPPLPEREFDGDPILPLNLSVCDAKVAPFHADNPAALAALMCFEECHTQNVTEAPEPPPFVDDGALMLANCTRACFDGCTTPRARECTVGCGEADFGCHAGCHRNATVCSVPRGPRDVLTFRRDPNEQVCYNLYEPYLDCVVSCHAGCREELRLSQRPIEAEIAEWFAQECAPPLQQAADEMFACIGACGVNCTRGCSITAGEDFVVPPSPPPVDAVQLALSGGSGAVPNPALQDPLYQCARGCPDVCRQQCFREGAMEAYAAHCEPPPEYNCTAACFGGVCTPVARFCSVYGAADADAAGARLLGLDLNCSGDLNANGTFAWGNRSVAALLADSASLLSRVLGVNATHDTCYSDCDGNSTHLDWITEGPGTAVTHNCTVSCYVRRCVDACLANCTLEAQLAALPPCELGPGCASLHNCTAAEVYGNCSAALAFATPRLNISAILDAAPEGEEIEAPAWDGGVCRSLVNATAGALGGCLRACERNCSQACITGENASATPGVCFAACLGNCSVGCASGATAHVETACVPPVEVVEDCVPPGGCLDDCGDECLDATYLLGEGGYCVELNVSLMGDATVISLPIAFNLSEPPQCSRNVSGECPRELLYYNVTEYARDVVVEPACIRQCVEDCTVKCFDAYCMTHLEEEANASATCLPRCLDKYLTFAPPPSPPPENATAAIAECLRACSTRCVGTQALGCSVTCDSILVPSVHAACLGYCVGNATLACTDHCIYNCTGNHTLAYGIPAPYEPADDYVTLDELFIPFDPPSDRHGSPTTDASTNRTAACYSNCTVGCNAGCFDAAVAACASERAAATAAAAAAAASRVPTNEAPLAVAAYNNCTIHRAGACVSQCASGCIGSCANETAAYEEAINLAELVARQEEELLDGYIDQCERSCRVQIYGYNITREEVRASRASHTSHTCYSYSSRASHASYSSHPSIPSHTSLTFA